MPVLAVPFHLPPELLGDFDESPVEDDGVLQVVPLRLLDVRYGRHDRDVQATSGVHRRRVVRQRTAYVVVPHRLARFFILLLEPKGVDEL